LFKKCTGCKREYEKDELEEIQSKQKVSKEKLLKNVCPDCHMPLKTYDESRFQKKWYGYLRWTPLSRQFFKIFKLHFGV